MSADLKKELIPKMKAALAVVMNRAEATREEPATDGNPPDRLDVRSMSDGLKAKLRPVPARRASSARILCRRWSDCRAQPEAEDSGMVPRSEAVAQPRLAGTSDGDSAKKTSGEALVTEGEESAADSWKRFASNVVSLPGGSGTAQSPTASNSSAADAPVVTVSVPTTPVSGRTPRRGRVSRQTASLPRNPQVLADRAVTPSTSLPPPTSPLPPPPLTLSAPLPVAPSVEDSRPPLPKIAISRGRNGVVRKKLIYHSKAHVVPSEIQEQGVETATQSDRWDGAKLKRRIRAFKANKAKSRQSECEEKDGSSGRRRRKQKRRGAAATAPGATSTAEEAATSVHPPPDVGRLSDRCEMRDASSDGDVSAAPPEGNSTQLPDRGPVKRVASFANRGRGRCGKSRRGGVTRSGVALQAPLIRATRHYARSGRVPQDWPVGTDETDDGFGRSDTILVPGGALIGVPESGASGAALDTETAETSGLVSAAAKPATPASGVQSKGQNRKVKRQGGGRRLENPSVAALRQREYRARRLAMGGLPLARTSRKRVQASDPANDSSPAAGPTNAEDATASSRLDPAVPIPLEETNTASATEEHRAELSGEAFNPLATDGNPQQPAATENRRQRRARRRGNLCRIASERLRYQRVYRMTHGLTLGGRPKQGRPKLAASNTALESMSVSGDTTVQDSIAAVLDSVVATVESAPTVSDPNTAVADITDPDDAAVEPSTGRKRGPRKRPGSGKQCRLPAGETAGEHKRRMLLVRSGRALPLSRGRPTGPFLTLKRFLKCGWEPRRNKDLMPTPAEDNLIWETVIEVSTDADGDYAETFAEIDGEANRLYEKASTALAIEELIELENELPASDSLAESYFCDPAGSTSLTTSEHQPVTALGDVLDPQKTDEQPARKVRRVHSLEEPERSVHIAYRGERGEQVDVIDGFRFVSFSSVSAMARFTRREEQRARRLRRRERRRANRRATIEQMKAERAASERWSDKPGAVDYKDVDWDPFLDISDTELCRTKWPELDKSSSCSSDLGVAAEEEPTLELDAVGTSELPFTESLTTASSAPVHCGRGRGRGRGFGRGRGHPCGSRSVSVLLRNNRFFAKKHLRSEASSSTLQSTLHIDMKDENTVTHATPESHLSEPSRPYRGRSRRRNLYEQIKKIAREAYAPVSQIPGSHSCVEHDPALASRLKALATAPAASSDSGIFSCPELDGYLREHGALRVSFNTPGAVAAANVVRAASPPPTPSLPRRAPPPPPSRREREPGEPRCRTVLELLTWHGYYSKEELEEGRAKLLADAAERAKVAEPESEFDFESVPVNAIVRSRRRPASPRGQHVPLVSRAGRLLPLSRVTDRSLSVRRAWDNRSNALGTLSYAYDQHQQLLVRGSVPNGQDHSLSRSHGAFRVATPARTVRPVNVEARVNAWRHDEYRVNTVPVDCILARMAAVAVCADSSVLASASGQSTPQTRLKKRRLVTDALGQRVNKHDEEEESKVRDANVKQSQEKLEQELEEKNRKLKEQEQQTDDQQVTESELDSGKENVGSSPGIEQVDFGKEKEYCVQTREMEVNPEVELKPDAKVDTCDQSAMEKRNNALKSHHIHQKQADANSSRSDALQETTGRKAASGESSFVDAKFDKRTSHPPTSTEDHEDNLQQTASTTISKKTEALASAEDLPTETISPTRESNLLSPVIQDGNNVVGDSQLMNSEASDSDEGETINEDKVSSPERATEDDELPCDDLADSVSDAFSAHDPSASDDGMAALSSTGDLAAAPSPAPGDLQKYIRETDVFELSMGTDVSPHKTQDSGEQPPVMRAYPPPMSASYRREMLRLGLPPPQRIEDSNSSLVDQQTPCSKEFCRLGCVCSSLMCGHRKKEHCGREECMLSCSCTGHTLGTSDATSALLATFQANLSAPGCTSSPLAASSGSGTSASVAGGRAKRARKAPVRFTKQDVWYGGPLTLVTSDDSPPPLQLRPLLTLPSHLPTYGEDILDKQYDQLGCRVKVLVPVYRLPQVHPFCIVHEVHGCHEYARNGTCSKPPRQRLRQLGRNVALRSCPLPPTISRPRHEHTARTFALRKARTPREFLPQLDSCCLTGAAYAGAQLPLVPVPPRRVFPVIPLPEPVDILEVSRVVCIQPTETVGKDDSNVDLERDRHYAVRLHSGMMSVLSKTPMMPRVTWRIQPANGVVVMDSSGRQFRNPSEGLGLMPVTVDANPGQLRRVPLVTLNFQVKTGRLRLRSADGGIVLFPKQRLLPNERLQTLHRVDMQSHKLHGNGMVVLRQDSSGAFLVIGATESASEENEWMAEAVRIMWGLGTGVGISDTTRHSVAIRHMLSLFDIQRVSQLGTTDLPLVPVMNMSATAKTNAMTYQMIEPTASTNNAQHNALTITPVEVPAVIQGGEKPRMKVAVGPGGQVRSLPPDNDKPAAEEESQPKALPGGELTRKRVVSADPPRIRLRVEDGKVVAVAEDGKRFKTSRTVSPRELVAQQPAKSLLKVVIKGERAVTTANLETSSIFSRDMSLLSAGQSAEKGAAAHITQATDGGVPGSEQGGVNTTTSAESTAGNSGYDKVFVSIQRQERDALRMAIIAAQGTPTVEKVSSQTPCPSVVPRSAQLPVQPAQELTRQSAPVTLIRRGKSSDVFLVNVSTASQVPTTSEPTSSAREPPLAQPSRLASSKALFSTSTPADPSMLPVSSVPVGAQPSGSVRTAAQASSQTRTSSCLSASASTANSKETPSSGSSAIVAFTTVNGITFLEEPLAKHPSSLTEITESVPPSSFNEVPATKPPCMSRETGMSKPGSVAKEAPVLKLMSNSEGLVILKPQPSHEGTSASKQPSISKESTMITPASSDKEGLALKPSTSKKASSAALPFKFRVVPRSTLPTTSKKMETSKPAPASKKATAPPSEAALKQGLTNRELPNTNETTVSQKSLNQKAPNEKDLSSGARLSFVRMPPQRVRGRMVTARFGGKPSRWNMIELEKLPDLMHVDGIPISLTRRYLKHAVHQVKNTGRPVSTKVNGLLVTIVWMPHLPDFVFLGPVVEELEPSAEPVAANPDGAAPTASGSGAAAVVSFGANIASGPQAESGPGLGERTVSLQVGTAKPKPKALPGSAAKVAPGPATKVAPGSAAKVASGPAAKVAPGSAAKVAPGSVAKTVVVPPRPKANVEAPPPPRAAPPPPSRAAPPPPSRAAPPPPSRVAPPPPLRAAPPPPLRAAPPPPSRVAPPLRAAPPPPSRAAPPPPSRAAPPPRAATPPPPPPNVADVGDPLSLSEELSTTLERPGAVADDADDDDILVLPPPAPRAPLDVILLDNSDISDDELVLDTNVSSPDPRPQAATFSNAPSTSAGSGSHLARLLMAGPTVREPKSAAATTSRAEALSSLPSRARPASKPKTSPSGGRRPRPVDEETPSANPTFDATKDSPLPKRRKQALTERSGDHTVSKLPRMTSLTGSLAAAFGQSEPLLSPRSRILHSTEYIASKRALEGLLFGRLENATPLRRKTTLVLKTAVVEVKSQRNRHSQLKVGLWQLSQKQRNLLNRLNRQLAELPLEKRIEKIAEIEDLLPFVQVRVEGDDLEPEMLLEKKISEQPSQFRVIASDSGAAAPEIEPHDTGELSEM